MATKKNTKTITKQKGLTVDEQLNFFLFPYIDEQLENMDLEGDIRPGLWPSEVSVIATVNDVSFVIGKCARQIFYRYYREPKTDYSGDNNWKFELGKSIEKSIVDQTKKAGLYRGSNVKFWNEELWISGEIDIIVRSPDDYNKLIFCEAKSTYGTYGKEELLGSKGRDGRPKIDQTLQLCTYLYSFRNNSNVIGGKMLYMLRDSTEHVEFNVVIDFNDPKLPIHYWAPESKMRLMEGFTFIDVIARYKYIREMIINKQLPDRDYSLTYSPDEVKDLYKAGEVSEATMKAICNKKSKTGHWRCRLCDWQKLCYSADPTPTILRNE